jgi:hypothetical protein
MYSTGPSNGRECQEPVVNENPHAEKDSWRGSRGAFIVRFIPMGTGLLQLNPEPAGRTGICLLMTL